MHSCTVYIHSTRWWAQSPREKLVISGPLHFGRRYTSASSKTLRKNQIRLRNCARPRCFYFRPAPRGGGRHAVRYESVWVDIAALITHCTKVSKAILQNWTSCHTSNVEFQGVGIINAKSNRLKIVFINLTY